MANGWTPERKARQSQLIQSWQPWNKSTGARTPEGKTQLMGLSTRLSKDYQTFRGGFAVGAIITGVDR